MLGESHIKCEMSLQCYHGVFEVKLKQCQMCTVITVLSQDAICSVIAVTNLQCHHSAVMGCFTLGYSCAKCAMSPQYCIEVFYVR